TSDGRGNFATSTYSYSGGAWYTYSGVRDRRFAGFSAVTATNPDSIVTTNYGQGALAQLGRPIERDVSDISNTLEKKTFYRWDPVTHGDGTFIGLGRQLEFDYGVDGSHRDKDTDYQYSSTTDDLLRVTQYGEVTGNPNLTFADVTGDTRTTTISYAASSSVNMSVPYEKTTFDNSGATSSDEKLYYDSLSLGQVNVGNNTRTEDWISGTRYASTTKTYNS